MCAIMNKLRAINAAPRHRLVLDLRIPVFWTGEFFSAAAGPARREIGPVVFNFRLMQPLFTSFPEFYAKTRYAPASRHGPREPLLANCRGRRACHAEARRRRVACIFLRFAAGTAATTAAAFQKDRYQFFKDFIYFSNLLMRISSISLCAFSSALITRREINNVQDNTHCLHAPIAFAFCPG